MPAKNQHGGDHANMYFHQTENIPGIQDARCQEIMPDVLVWLGVRRIDWLLSMSHEKYDALTAAGITIVQRVSRGDTCQGGRWYRPDEVRTRCHNVRQLYVADMTYQAYPILDCM